LLALADGDAREALTIAERAKSRALIDAIAGAVELRPRGGVLARRLARELAAAREDYAAASTQIVRESDAPDSALREATAHRLSKLEGRIAVLVQRLQLAGAGDELADIYTSAPVTTLPDMPPDTALLEYYFCGESIIRFVISDSGVRGEVLAARVPEVERSLRAFQLNLSAVESASPEQLPRLDSQARGVLARLRAQLLGDLDELTAYRSLVVVPHGLLHYLPFHALYDGKQFVIEQHAVSYAPSATLFAVCRARTGRPRPRGRALVMAHSAGGQLPYALTEADAVAEVLGVDAHREQDATRASLRSGGRGRSIIHLAAHGRFRADAPLFSAIELADGPLTAVDVFNLELNAGLITLSACETGRAVIGGGDELVGLTRAFLYAGATRLLVSQWRVDDASTASLMTSFYRELQRGANCAEALRSAQISQMMTTQHEIGHAHPFYWAAFQFIGDERQLQRRPVRAR
jgi:CHAT domain-containing protein